MTDDKISLPGLFVWLIAALFFMYEFFLRTFVGTVAKQVIPALHLTAESFAVVSSAYYLSYALMQIPVGILSDKFGVKRIMCFAAIVCGLSTLWFAFSQGFYSAFFSRLLMGFGSAFAFVCLLVVAATWFPRKYFGFFAGASQFIGTMGPMMAGGPLVELMAKSHGNWRVTMSEVSVIGFILAFLIMLFVKNKPRGGKQALILLQQNEPLSVRLYRLLSNRQAWLIALYSACVYVSISLLAAVWGTDYLMANGFSQSLAASMISLAWFAYAIGCPLLGAVSDLSKRRKPMLLFCAMMSIVVTLAITFGHLSVHWMVGIIFLGLGVAASGQNVGFAIIAENVDAETKATALGLNNGLILLFGAIMPPVISFFVNQAAHGSSHFVVSDFTLGFTFMPILSILAFFIALFGIKETYCKPQKEAIVLSPK